MVTHEFARRAGTALRKCMKGRFGCGGSNHPRLRVNCASASNCAPFGETGALGCNFFGADMWYCSATTNRCTCVETLFHEGAHSCGIGHSVGYLLRPRCPLAGERACDFGEWFFDQFESSNNGCFGSLLQSGTKKEGNSAR